jgi:mannitol-1-phosphate/altronate dehydrogenase
VSIIGVGVTEAGLASKDTKVMADLYDLLKLIAMLIDEGKWRMVDNIQQICVVDMDNVPNNGDLVAKYMMELAETSDDSKMKDFLINKVAFLNTMVDRITSQRPGSNGMVPRCEPTPAKALVILDPQGNLPQSTYLSKQPGMVIRSTSEELNIDINLKLRIANGTHTAIAHTLALLRHYQTDVLAKDASPSSSLFMKYLDALVDDQIIPAACQITTKDEALVVWTDWRQRLVHPYFGLSSFFITQNGPAKGGIRWGPTVVDLLSSKDNAAVSTTASLAFAYAALLRWLTPIPSQAFNDSDAIGKSEVFVGWLDGFLASDSAKLTSRDTESAVEYADGLRYNQEQGWYEFRSSLNVPSEDMQAGETVPLTKLLQRCIGKQPQGCSHAVRAYMLASEGGNLSSVQSVPELQALIDAVTVLYSRLVNGDSVLTVLKELDEKSFSMATSSMSDGLSSQNNASGNEEN